MIIRVHVCGQELEVGEKIVFLGGEALFEGMGGHRLN